jgi:hypothetical protein
VKKNNMQKSMPLKSLDSLKQVKICDPAIGSGAFPMGLLQEIFNAQIFLLELSKVLKENY